jgi:DNA repair exonuclease SbcCD ATPase subunit
MENDLDNLSSFEDKNKLTAENDISKEELNIKEEEKNDDLENKISADVQGKEEVIEQNEFNSENLLSNNFIASKIEDYERKLKEQEKYNEQFSQNEAFNGSSNDKEQLNQLINKDEKLQYHALSKKIDQLHKDIATCESYKKSLKNDIKRFRNNISEIKKLEKKIHSLKQYTIILKSESDKIRMENVILREKNKNIKTISKDLDKKVEKLLEIYNQNNNEIEIYKKEKEFILSEQLQKIKNDLSEEIQNMNDRREDLVIQVNELSSSKEKIDEEIQNNIKTLKEDVERELEKYNQLLT